MAETRRSRGSGREAPRARPSRRSRAKAEGRANIQLFFEMTNRNLPYHTANDASDHTSDNQSHCIFNSPWALRCFAGLEIG